MHLLCCFLTACLLMFIVHKSSRAKCAALCCCRAVTTLQSWEPPSSAGSLGHRDCPEPSKAPFVYLTRLQAQLKQSPHSPPQTSCRFLASPVQHNKDCLWNKQHILLHEKKQSQVS